jgi:Fe2+ or Zn2+ uptake regulation protein
MKITVDNIKKSGYKITGPRQSVLQYLQKQKQPRSAKEIHESISKFGIDKVTIYRVLELFVNIGIVFEEKLFSESLFYMSDNPHHHAFCQKCHYIECVPCHNEIAKPKNFSSINHSLMISGICKNCS